MENAGAVCPGVLVLTAGLSKPFRRLGKYPAMLQELARHVHEAHPDRGDTHRASVVYKDIAVSITHVSDFLYNDQLNRLCFLLFVIFFTEWLRCITSTKRTRASSRNR